MTVARLMVVRTVDGKITVAPAPWTLTDRINALHAELWRLEPGPVHADRRDELRRMYFALHRARHRTLPLDIEPRADPPDWDWSDRDPGEAAERETVGDGWPEIDTRFDREAEDRQARDQ